jgi:hypothetical protein
MGNLSDSSSFRRRNGLDRIDGGGRSLRSGFRDRGSVAALLADHGESGEEVRELCFAPAGGTGDANHDGLLPGSRKDDQARWIPI